MHLLELPSDALRLIDALSEVARVCLRYSGARTLAVRVRAADRPTQLRLVDATWAAVLPELAHTPFRACDRATAALETRVRRALPGARLTRRAGELALPGPLRACSRATATALRAA